MIVGLIIVMNFGKIIQSAQLSHASKTERIIFARRTKKANGKHWHTAQTTARQSQGAQSKANTGHRAHGENRRKAKISGAFNVI